MRHVSHRLFFSRAILFAHSVRYPSERVLITISVSCFGQIKAWGFLLYFSSTINIPLHPDKSLSPSVDSARLASLFSRTCLVQPYLPLKFSLYLLPPYQRPVSVNSDLVPLLPLDPLPHVMASAGCESHVNSLEFIRPPPRYSSYLSDVNLQCF